MLRKSFYICLKKLMFLISWILLIVSLWCSLFNMFSLIFEISCKLEVRSGCMMVRIRFLFDRVAQRWSWAVAGTSPRWHDVSGLEWRGQPGCWLHRPPSDWGACIQQQWGLLPRSVTSLGLLLVTNCKTRKMLTGLRVWDTKGMLWSLSPALLFSPLIGPRGSQVLSFFSSLWRLCGTWGACISLFLKHK